MVVGFTTTYAMSITTNVVSSIQHYVIKFVSDLQQVSGFLRALRFPRNKTDRHDITEILLKVALNTINLNQPTYFSIMKHISLGYINGIYISMVEHFSFKFLMK